jgi:hypothetical protein
MPVWRFSVEGMGRILYLALMKYLVPFLGLLMLSGCASRSIDSGAALESILTVPHADLEKEDVEVVKVSNPSGSEAIAETRLKTAFRIEKVDGRWVVKEVRFGHGQWEKIDNLAAALTSVKTGETRMMLERIAEAIQKYREATGQIPKFRDYVDLSDQLSPRYLTPLIRLDSWRQPLDAQNSGAGSIILGSSGPDRKLGTHDDIRLTAPR